MNTFVKLQKASTRSRRVKRSKKKKREAPWSKNKRSRRASIKDETSSDEEDEDGDEDNDGESEVDSDGSEGVGSGGSGGSGSGIKNRDNNNGDDEEIADSDGHEMMVNERGDGGSSSSSAITGQKDDTKDDESGESTVNSDSVNRNKKRKRKRVVDLMNRYEEEDEEDHDGDGDDDSEKLKTEDATVSKNGGIDSSFTKSNKKTKLAEAPTSNRSTIGVNHLDLNQEQEDDDMSQDDDEMGDEVQVGAILKTIAMNQRSTTTNVEGAKSSSGMNGDEQGGDMGQSVDTSLPNHEILTYFSKSSIDQFRVDLGNHVACLIEKEGDKSAQDLCPSALYDIVFHVDHYYLFSYQSVLVDRCTFFHKLITEAVQLNSDQYCSLIEIQIPPVNNKEMLTVQLLRRVIEYCACAALLNIDFVVEIPLLYTFCECIQFDEMKNFILQLVIQLSLDKSIKREQAIRMVTSLQALGTNYSEDALSTARKTLSYIVESGRMSFFATYPPMAEETDQEYISVLSNDNLPYNESELFLNVVLFRVAYILTNSQLLQQPLDSRVIVGKSLDELDKEQRQVLFYEHAGLTLRCYSTSSHVMIDGLKHPRVIFELYQGDTPLGQVTNDYMRENLMPVLPNIRFETFSVPEIFESVEPTQLVLPDELLSFLKAGYLRDHKRTYQILSQSFDGNQQHRIRRERPKTSVATTE